MKANRVTEQREKESSSSSSARGFYFPHHWFIKRSTATKKQPHNQIEYGRHISKWFMSINSDTKMSTIRPIRFLHHGNIGIDITITHSHTQRNLWNNKLRNANDGGMKFEEQTTTTECKVLTTYTASYVPEILIFFFFVFADVIVSLVSPNCCWLIYFNSHWFCYLDSVRLLTRGCECECECNIWIKRIKSTAFSVGIEREKEKIEIVFIAPLKCVHNLTHSTVYFRFWTNFFECV